MTSRAPLTAWDRRRHLAVVALLGLGFALTLAIFAEGTVARPRCQAYGAPRTLVFAGLEYPSAPPGVPGRRRAACLFVGDDRRVVAVPFVEVAPAGVTAALVDLATTPLVTTPLMIAILAFLLFQVYGALGLRDEPRRGPGAARE